MNLIRFISEEEYNSLITDGIVRPMNTNKIQWSTSVLYFFRIDGYDIDDFIEPANLLDMVYEHNYKYMVMLNDPYAKKTFGLYPIEEFDKHLPFEVEQDDSNKYYYRIPESKLPYYRLEHITKLYRVINGKLIETPIRVKQEATRMRRTIKLEASQLESLELESLVLNTLKSKHGLTSSLNQIDACLYTVAVEKFANTADLDKIDIEGTLESIFKKIKGTKDITVMHDDNLFYVGIELEDTKEAIKEVTQATSIGSKQEYVCALCGDKHKGWGNNGWPITKVGDLVCDECNSTYVVPERINMLMNPKAKTEATNASDVSKQASNSVLDNKFIWLFSVMDENAKDIKEGIKDLQDAINFLIKNNGAFLVAFPYIDANPEDPNVDLVFSDVPGPVVIYSREDE